jgi:acetyl esterase
MPLHPEIQRFLEQLAETSAGIPADDPVRAARDKHRLQIDIGSPEHSRAAVDAVDDTLVDMVPVRVYRPDDRRGHPIAVFLHSGGWMTGDLETADPLARTFAAGLPAIVVSVDYRRVPEHPWPAPLDDARAVTTWVLNHAGDLGGDPTRVLIAGDSAGAHLAALVSRSLARDGDRRLALQLLLYPTVVLRIDLETYPSQVEHARDQLLSTDALASLYPQVFPDEDVRRAAVLLGPGGLSGLPPAVVATAEYNPLHDEGLELARELAAAGIPVRQHTGAGLCHGYADIVGASSRVRQEIAGIVANARSFLTSP